MIRKRFRPFFLRERGSVIVAVSLFNI